MEIFYSRSDMVSLAVVEEDRPIGLINRDILLSQMSKPFHRELYGKKSCIAFMDKEPLIVDASMSIEALTFKTAEAGNKALTDGFVVTREGKFAGLGSGSHLLGAVAQMQAEKNRQIMQSIEYASVIQQAMLRVSRDTLSSILPDASLVWEPRDVVGGDFYHFASFPDGWFGAVADCTGHGVPGAFMTLLASSSLSQALEKIGPRNPAALLAAVNRNVKSLLGQVDKSGVLPQSNDGLDAIFFWFDAEQRQLLFSGARIALHVLRSGAEQFESISGERMGVGYVDSLADYEWTLNTLTLPHDSLLFVSTDGLIDQIGGPKRISFGKRRALSHIVKNQTQSLSGICDGLQRELAEWQGTQGRRDDVTLFFARV
ncbi:SpoIIE family protein phosphatase [Paraburkholderia sp. GAS199]|uniref:SpoIIE family protein phosphatase n=1 Tax=Paraburkholderia sp. GAS199 TaxID=3035126 RepID=UPI003D1FDC39